jgi:hypothetical protein
MHRTEALLGVEEDYPIQQQGYGGVAVLTVGVLRPGRRLGFSC